MGQWEQWIPLEGLAKKYYIDHLSGTENSVMVTLSADDQEDKRTTQIVFCASVIGYRRTTETFNITLFEFLRCTYGGPFYWEWSFFTVVHSPYMQLIGQGSHSSPMHYVILAIDSVVDVIATIPPNVEILNSKIF
jgi:hypothetical protein